MRQETTKSDIFTKSIDIPQFRLKFLLELIRDRNQKRCGQCQKGRGEIFE